MTPALAKLTVDGGLAAPNGLLTDTPMCSPLPLHVAGTWGSLLISGTCEVDVTSGRLSSADLIESSGRSVARNWATT